MADRLSAAGLLTQAQKTRPGQRPAAQTFGLNHLHKGGMVLSRVPLLHSGSPYYLVRLTCLQRTWVASGCQELVSSCSVAGIGTMEFMLVVAASSTMPGSPGMGGAASRKSHSTTSSEIGPFTWARLRMSLGATISYCVRALGSANAVTIFSVTTASIFATGVGWESPEASRSTHSRDRFVRLCIWS